MNMVYRKLVIRCMAVSTVLIVAAAIGWLWVQWPVRVAERFLTHASAAEFEDCRAMLKDPNDPQWVDAKSVLEQLETGMISIESRSGTDVLFGRLSLVGRDDDSLEFKVVRNRIEIISTRSWELRVIEFRLKQLPSNTSTVNLPGGL